MKTSYRLSEAAFRLDGKMPLKQAIPLGLQHVLAMFVGNLTPLLIITGACGIAGGEFADLQLQLLQNAMLVAGIVTLVQLFAIGPVGGKVPIIMGTSSGFIGVFNSVAAGGSTDPDNPHEGEEFGYVLNGAVTIHLGNKVYRAKKGETFYYVSGKQHYLTSKVGATVLWISSPPTF